MAGELQARRRKVKEAKDAGGGDSDDDQLEEPSRDGSTCLSAVVLVVLLGGVGVLLTLVYVQSGAVRYGDPPAPQRPLARPAEVVVERSDPSDSSRPPQPPGEDPGAEGTTVAATTESATSDGAGDGSPPGEGAPPADHTAALSGAPAPPPPPQGRGEFRLEGSEEAPLDAEGAQPVQKEVRVRQMLRIHTHADGSITEEVISEQLLQPGDEGYDDLGKEPVTVAVGSEPVTTSTKPVMTITASEGLG